MRVKNLIRWFPTIWGDDDSDPTCIWRLLQKKLVFVRKHLLENGKFDADLEGANRLSKIIFLLEKQIHAKQYFENPAMREHEFKWGKMRNYYENCGCVQRCEKAETLADQRLELRERLANLKFAKREQERSRKKLVRLLCKEIDKWVI